MRLGPVGKLGLKGLCSLSGGLILPGIILESSALLLNSQTVIRRVHKWLSSSVSIWLCLAASQGVLRNVYMGTPQDNYYVARNYLFPGLDLFNLPP